MRRKMLIAGICLLILHTATMAAAAVAAQVPPVNPQFLSRDGTLPSQGRLVIRSGLAWLDETSPLFKVLTRELAQDLAARGLLVVPVPSSCLDPLPQGTRALQAAAVPELPGRGRRQRLMSVPEASARMQAMHLARTGKLPQVRFGNQTDILQTLPGQAKPGNGPGNGSGSGLGKAVTGQSSGGGSPARSSVLPAPLTGAELIRYALSQEEGHPALRGHVDVPGRLPQELRQTDPDVAEYALVVRFAMLWPAGTQGTGRQQAPKNSIVAGWHLLILTCYDLAPARKGRELRRIWNATVQRVVSDPELGATLPEMAHAALAR